MWAYLKQDKLIEEIKVLEGDIEVSFETEDNYKNSWIILASTLR